MSRHTPFTSQRNWWWIYSPSFVIYKPPNVNNFSRYSSKTKCVKLKLVVLAYILDTTRVNVETLVKLTNPDNCGTKPSGKAIVKSVDIGLQLVEGLTFPWINARPLKGLPSFVTNAAYRLTGNSRFQDSHTPQLVSPTALAFPYSATAPKKPKGKPDKKHCRVCVAEIHGDNYTERRKKDFP